MLAAFFAPHSHANALGDIDSVFQAQIDAGEMPHILTYVWRDGKIIHNKAFGWRDIEEKAPLRRDDIFQLYSQTKAVVSVALMTLYEQGNSAWTTPFPSTSRSVRTKFL